ncbi:YkvA family protein [Lyngbya confervoides]|uniref:YkvA family protein n=1 Tax=Lyngbya confervoides BDU141951 TaxID=1574623 RepID=A0ABD4SYA3_9CYAN|nr:YkvA family protein [Lyngbya confervoides]MCM1981308.1 YkvA family protein [Lyngbya confervoides BDU141951]
MKSYITALYGWYRQTLRNPRYRWWVILGTAAYLFSPFDLSPDLFPVLGQIDDVAIVSLLVAELSQIAMDYMKSRQKGMGDAEAVEVEAVPVQES